MTYSHSSSSSTDSIRPKAIFDVTEGHDEQVDDVDNDDDIFGGGHAQGEMDAGTS